MLKAACFKIQNDGKSMFKSHFHDNNEFEAVMYRVKSEQNSMSWKAKAA